MNNVISGLCFSVVVSILMFAHRSEAQRVFLVGDNIGWTNPEDSSTYQSWVSDKTFAVGDILSFDFQTAQHNVIEVSEESYTSCSSANPIGTVYDTGPVNVTLNTGGQHYYICGIGQHCTRGQKLAINVSASPSVSPPSAAVAPAATTTPPPMSLASTFFPAFIPLFLLLSSFIIVFLE